MQEWIEILKTFGPSVAFMIFTVWRDWNRENRMSHALEVQAEQLLSITKSTITAIEQNTASNKQLTQAIERLPCRTTDEPKEHTRRNAFQHA